MFEGVFSHSILKRAQETGMVRIETVDLRRFSRDKHNRLDDTQYGGGAGMVLRPEPLFRALEYLKTGLKIPPWVILMDAGGEVLTQSKVDSLAKLEHLIIVCGRYKGVDRRFVQCGVEEEISLGDYVLSGGETASLVLLEAMTRLLPDVVGDKESVNSDSFISGLLDAPYYTRPQDFRGYKVPEVLVSGNHQKVKEWRDDMALKLTKEKRPDLLRNIPQRYRDTEKK